MKTNSQPNNQPAQTKKVWQKPEVLILDTNDVNAKHQHYAHESQYSKSVPAGSVFHWYRAGTPHDAGLHGGPLKSLVS